MIENHPAYDPDYLYGLVAYGTEPMFQELHAMLRQLRVPISFQVVNRQHRMRRYRLPASAAAHLEAWSDQHPGQYRITLGVENHRWDWCVYPLDHFRAHPDRCDLAWVEED